MHCFSHGERRKILKIGLGLPNSAKSLHSGRLLVDIARRAEELDFSTLMFRSVTRAEYGNRV